METKPLHSKTLHLDKKEGSYINEIKLSRTTPMNADFLEVPADLGGNVVISSINTIIDWARKASLWPLSFGLACCAFEMMASAMGRFDLARFGGEVLEHLLDKQI